MKISNVLFQTTCALALMVTSDMACAMMASGDAEGDKREERVSAARSVASQLGVVIPAGAVITPELAEGYETAGQVSRFYKVVQPVVPAAFPTAPTAQTWTDLAQEAAQGRYSSFFKQVMTCVGTAPSYGGVRIEEFRDRVAADAGRLTHAKQADPREVGRYLGEFVDSLADTGQVLARKQAVDQFRVDLGAAFPVFFAGHIVGDGTGSHSQTSSASLDELRAVLAENVRMAKGVVPVVELLGEGEQALTLQEEMGILARRIDTLQLIRDNEAMHRFGESLRNFVYALFLNEQAGKEAEAVAAAKAGLLSSPAFQALEGAAGTQYAAEAESLRTSERLEEARRALVAAREEVFDLAKSLVSLHRSARHESRELADRYYASLDRMGRAYQDLAWAKALTLSVESAAQ